MNMSTCCTNVCLYIYVIQIHAFNTSLYEHDHFYFDLSFLKKWYNAFINYVLVTNM